MPRSSDSPIVPSRRPVMLALLAGGLGLTARAIRAQPADEVRIGGTGVAVAPVQMLMEGVPGVRIVPNLGTGGGLKALAAGAIDIALSARPPQDAERTRGLVGMPLVRTPFVFAVHPAVSVRRVTLAELAALYAGRTDRWPDGSPVRTVLRPERDSDADFVRGLSPAMAEALAQAAARAGTFIAVTDGDATDALDRIAGGLGVTTLGLLKAENRRARPLDLDGVQPTLEAMVSGRYPHAKAVHLVTRGAPTPPVQAVIDRLLGRALMPRWTALGYQPASAA